MKSRRIGLLGFDGVMALDLVGPIDAFSSAVFEGAGGALSPCYEISVIGLSQRPFVSESGIVFQPHTTLKNVPALDTLLIPGGCGLRVPQTQATVAEWVKARAAKLRRIATVCTGIYGLAPTGLLDGRTVTTHWRFARDLGKRYPKLNVDANAIFCKDGPFYTGAGITSGIDLSLALIEEDYGPTVALAVARELVVYVERSGGQEQYSEPLKFQTRSKDGFGDLAAWIHGHLEQDLSVETLAHRARLCPRHFCRRFKDVFGTSPARFVEDLRLGEARQRLSLADQSIETVARSVGFASPDAFRRAFERRFGINPSSFRNRFDVRLRRRRHP
jgi:transcriptional regulator GlxA family with amidase domain